MNKAPKSDILYERRVFGNNIHRDNLLEGCCRTTAIEDYALRWCRGHGVDFGYGDSGAYNKDKDVEHILSGANGVDIGVIKPKPLGMEQIARDESISSTCFPDNMSHLDFIFSSHCLEHIADWKEVLTYWRSRLREGGILFLYLPHESVAGWRPETAKDHIWKPTIVEIVPFLRDIEFKIIEYMVGCDSEGSFYIISEKI